MSIPLAYLGIVLIWSTTPLAIQWSSQGIGFAFAVLARMSIGVVVASMLLLAWRIRLPMHARARRAYLVGGVGVFGAMVLTYWGAAYIHSGLVSVLFGLSPLMAGALAALCLGERGIGRRQVLGMLLGCAGLAVIFVQGDSLAGEHALAGLGAVLAAVLIYSASLVWLKRIDDDSPPLASTVGSLLVSLPLFALVWWFVDGGLPDAVPWRSAVAVAYLGVFGSVIGFALYYYVIKHLDSGRVALITLITPVLALLLGHLLNGEEVAPRIWLGSATILSGLVVHQWQTLIRDIGRR
ncbi:MAG: DMT family transporter [Rhodocyclales bacterium GT-UBC]|nr:MAG: DMT family transporter [Rhodocyclales bacterium GT-UBC]